MTVETATVLQTIGILITAAVALVYGGYQLYLLAAGHRREAAKQKESKDREEARRRGSADTIWRQYELLCIEHPDFACPELSNLDLDRKTFDGDARKFISYEYFVSFLLWASEEILGVYGHEKDWEDSILDETDWHHKYLTSAYFEEYLPTTSAEMKKMIVDMKERRGCKRHHM